jgi:arylsulfatase A-like enzyme
MWDVMPTACELAGAPVPLQTDGISLVPTLTGVGEQREHDYLYWEFNENIYLEKTEYKQAVRMGDWKGIHYVDTGLFELYDLKSDPGERRNVATEHPAVVEELLALMAEAHVPSERFPLLPSERSK